MLVTEFKSAIDCRTLIQAKVGKKGIQTSDPSLWGQKVPLKYSMIIYKEKCERMTSKQESGVETSD
jgi:hypothetical protein